LRETGVQKKLSRSVIKLIGGAGFDDTQIIGNGAEGSER
jgi:hypothetical protein